MSRAKEKSMCEVLEKQGDPSQQRRSIELSDRKKPILLRQLENQLKHLDDIDEDQDLQECEDPCLKDQSLERLRLIAKEANKLQILEIEKLCRLAIGKRILNLQMKKKKDEHNAKLKKKEKIQLFFRENRIERYDYDTLLEEKLAKDTLISRAYQNGKGFLQYDKLYQSRYSTALAQCRYTPTIKEVNKMFYRNYSGNIKSNSLVDLILKLVWMPILLFVILGLLYPFASFPYQQFLLLVLLAIVVMMLGTAAVMTFLEKPSMNNQIEQTIEDVRNYFENVNQNLALQGKNIQWVCPKEFMYLEVIFLDGIPS